MQSEFKAFSNEAPPGPRSRSRRAALAMLATLALVAGGTAQAQEFPIKGKPIRVTVAFPPGAGPDAMARTMLTAFTPISMGARGPLVIIVNSALGINNVQELVAYGRANPNKLSYGSFGVGTSSHIFGQVFARNTGIEMEHVPYKGGAEMAGDLIEGRLQMAFDAAPQAIQTAKTGKAKIIAVAAPKRNPFMPNVPTVLEQGVKDVDITSFVAWFGPAGMRPEVVNKLNAAIGESLAQPAVKAHFNESAYTAEGSTPAELAGDVKRAYDAWGALVKSAGIPKQ